MFLPRIAKVTIWGESSGVLSVYELLAAPPLTPSGTIPFRAAIMDSRATHENNKSNADKFKQLSQNVTCRGKLVSPVVPITSTEVSCVSNTAPSTIALAVNSLGLKFQPLVDDLTSVNSISGVTQQTANIPVMIGSNANESNIFPRNCSQQLH
jgi:carboxylesterase type B